MYQIHSKTIMMHLLIIYYPYMLINLQLHINMDYKLLLMICYKHQTFMVLMLNDLIFQLNVLLHYNLLWFMLMYKMFHLMNNLYHNLLHIRQITIHILMNMMKIIDEQLSYIIYLNFNIKLILITLGILDKYHNKLFLHYIMLDY